MPAYLSTVIREGSPICPHLVLLPLQILPHIGNILAGTSKVLDPGAALSIPYISHNLICLIYLSYDKFGLFPSFVLLPLVRPNPLPKIPTPPPNR